MKEKKDGIAKDVSCILERANEQTENTYINMWTHLETQNMCMLGD